MTKMAGGKRVFYLLVSVILTAALLAGCTGSSGSGQGENGKKNNYDHVPG